MNFQIKLRYQLIQVQDILEKFEINFQRSFLRKFYLNATKILEILNKMNFNSLKNFLI